jgi:phosphatidylglycerol:prolipoprotein diacylglycerol transferase
MPTTRRAVIRARRKESAVQPLIPWFEVPILRIPLPAGLPWEELPIHGFGILVAVGFMLGGQVAMNASERRGLDPEVINRLIGWLIAGTFIGGHVGYGLMYERERYLADPRQFLYMWQGLSSYGGFVACVPIAIWFLRREKVPIWPYVDSLAIGLTLGWFFGRMGCFVAHDHPGTPTNFFLGVYGICFNEGRSVACHDMGLYEAIWSLSMFGLFMWMERKPRVPGLYAGLLATAYAPVRFGMDFLRPLDHDPRYFGLTPAQWWSMVFLVLGLWVISTRVRSGDAPFWKTEGESETPEEGGAA